MSNKVLKHQRFIPGFYKPSINPLIRGTIYALGTEDEVICEQIAEAKRQIFVRSAEKDFLDALGSNVGVFRPSNFNLSDELYRDLIPTLSFHPKQVLPTIQRVLEIFWGPNPIIAVNEINPNEIVIRIPSAVPSLRRDLRGSHHFHAYSGTIVSVDNILKEMVVDLEVTERPLVVDELIYGGKIGQGNAEAEIISNSAGATGIILQFSAGEDLSDFVASEEFVFTTDNYPGSFIPDPTAAFTVTGQRGVLGQAITAGSQTPLLTMLEASRIPNTPGLIIINRGLENEESLIKYFSRPNNSTLFIDPTHIFAYDHAIGDTINVILTPYRKPNIDGTDYSVYLVGITAARILAQSIIESIVAAGVVIRWIIVEPEC